MSIWSNLIFNAGSTATNMANSLSWRYNGQNGGGVHYYSKSAYKSVLAHVAKQVAMSSVENTLKSLVPRYLKSMEDKMRESARKQQDIYRQKLIEHGERSTEGFGRLICDGGHTLIAKTKYGTPVPEALILSYTDIHSPVVTYYDTTGGQTAYNVRNKGSLESIWNPSTKIDIASTPQTAVPFTTRTVFHIDLVPRVSVNSTKNVVLTQVQGRDYTRKELVSGGDMTYSVSGSIVSDEPGVYPTEAVKRFVKIMQYSGIVDVNYITFNLLGINKVLIKDFSLSAPEYKNIQPYTFTCVAVEPDDAIALNNDTIAVINNRIAESSWDSWYKAILDNKLVQIAASKALDATTSVVNAGLDALTSNI